MYNFKKGDIIHNRGDQIVYVLGKTNEKRNYYHVIHLSGTYKGNISYKYNGNDCDLLSHHFFCMPPMTIIKKFKFVSYV
jgi:hypothetical protein